MVKHSLNPPHHRIHGVDIALSNCPPILIDLNHYMLIPMLRFFILIAFGGLLSLQAQGHELIFQSKVATALNTITLFSDTSLTKHSNIFFEQGELFEVIGESYYEHEDASQNQKFKWYHVRTLNGKTGWVFGDAVAVILPKDEIAPAVSSYHRKRFMFNNGFEKAVMWFGVLQGRDNFHEQDYLNPLYTEYYLIITNEKGKSTQINYAGQSAIGKSELYHFQMTDMTGDKIPEFIFQKKNHPTGSEIENRDLLIYSFQAGTLLKVFEERLTLLYDAQLASPTLYKAVEIEPKNIRIEYIDFLNCTDYSQQLPTDPQASGSEKCLEYVTYSFHWDDRSNSFYRIYDESRSPVKASMRFNGIYLKNSPKLTGKNIRIVKRTELFTVVKHHENFIKNSSGKKVMDNYLYIVLPSGEKGYVSADKVAFANTYHADVLIQYYRQAPLHKNDWKYSGDFVKFFFDRHTSVRKR
ncbi:MAG TPA: SH3 domain-containing protein [Phaeodactylibacter sp.]|nr:SH3 domain-containing protein [Phaeodactylibacter sp.]